MSKFSVRLHQLRKENNMTQDELCERIKAFGYRIDKPNISRYENGVNEPNFYFVQLAADVFGVTTDYLMGRSDNKYDLGVNSGRQIPIMGTIAAGQPIMATENIIGYEYSSDCDFCLKVKGDSMTGARIYDGDIVYIHKQPEVENGEIAAVIIDGEEATLKRFYKVDGIIRLHSENPIYPDMVFSKKDSKQIRILGKVKYFKAEVK
jgi:repressor LexA